MAQSDTGQQESFGELLRRARKRAGISLEDLARRARLGSVSHLSKLERGEANNPKPETVRRLARAVGWSEGEFLTAAYLIRSSHNKGGAGDAEQSLVETAQRDAAGTAAVSKRRKGDMPRNLRGRARVWSDAEVAEINAAWRLAHLVQLSRDPGYISEARPPADDLDPLGVEERLAVVRNFERQHDRKLLGETVE